VVLGRPQEIKVLSAGTPDTWAESMFSKSLAG
jgi:hypothetical protein